MKNKHQPLERKKIFAEMSFGKEFTATIGISDMNGRNQQFRDMHSFTNNFMQYLRCALLYPRSGNRYVYDNTGDLVPKDASHYNFAQVSANTSIYNGIMIGTGLPVRTAAMVALGAPLDAVSIAMVPNSLVNSVNIAAGGSNILIVKAFRNITANPITVTEIALSSILYTTTPGYTILSHDILNPAVVIPAGEVKVFSIRLDFANTVPAQLVRILSLLFWVHDEFPPTIVNYKSTLAILYQYGLSFSTQGNTYYSSCTSGTGLLIGSAATAPIYTDYKVTAIGLRTSTYSYPSVQMSGSDTYIDFTGTYINNGASPITVAELGIYIGDGGSVSAFLIARHLLSIPVVMAPSEIIEATFRIKTVFA